MNIRRFSTLALAPLLTFSAGLCAQESQNLTDLDLTTLMGMDVTVTSVTKREQTWSDAAAAVYVITREDIRRSGAMSLPEVLRLAPGVQVARINARSWAITARGFNSRFANKLLVMVDGRSIYTPMFSGVIWEEQPVVLEEIERVEIVRGPGGALWGINAVNGVINIITRSAENGAGLHAHGSAGSNEQQSAGVSYGGNNDALGAYRLYLNHDHWMSVGLNKIESTQAGWRVDRSLGEGTFTFQGNLSEGDFGTAPPRPAASLATSAKTGSVSASWQSPMQAGQWEVSGYYSTVRRGVPGHWDESMFGFDTQLSFNRAGRHVFTVGATYRNVTDEMGSYFEAMTLTDPKDTQHQWGVYAQDEVNFFDDAVQVILGSKLENLEYTGLAVQPTFRTLWHASDQHTLWAAASRAVRTPSRTELDSRMSFGFYAPEGLVLIRMDGDENLDAEVLHAYELGWRWRPYQKLGLDIAVFRNDYDNLIAAQQGIPSFEFFPIPALILPATFANLDSARAEGVGTVIEWAAADWLRLEGQATWQHTETTGTAMLPGSIDPRRVFSMRSEFNVTEALDLDVSWRSVSDLQGMGVKGYDTLNLRAAWRPTDNLELSVFVDNVLDNEHMEFTDDLTVSPGATFGRTFIARATWRPER